MLAGLQIEAGLVTGADSACLEQLWRSCGVCSSSSSTRELRGHHRHMLLENSMDANGCRSHR